MSDEAINGDRRWGCGCGTIGLIAAGGLLALVIGGFVAGQAINAHKMNNVKIGMTPDQVKELLGQPVTTYTVGEDQHESIYRGFGESHSIHVVFDSKWKVVDVKRYYAPSWFQHMVG
jgi:hypothetical protein